MTNQIAANLVPDQYFIHEKSGEKFIFAQPDGAKHVVFGAQAENELVFDIGANNGDDTAEYLKHGCKVVAVEANPDLCKAIRARFVNQIDAGQLVLIDKAISRNPKVTLYINTSDHGWGTTLPSYAERARKLGGSVVEVEVETVTVIDLIRAYGVPYRITIDIEGADILCLLDLYDGELPQYLSIERPKSISNQFFAMTLLRRMGYRRLAFVDQTVWGEQAYTTTGLFSEQLPAKLWRTGHAALVTNVWIAAKGALASVIRRTPGLRSVAPRGRWFDIHVSRS
jgi:FkbM family methyltransferase